MFDVLVVLSYIATGVEMMKEKLAPTVPVENWANKELYNQDIINGVPMEQVMKNLHNGKYKQTAKHPKPHRDKDGKFIVENCKLFEEDISRYGVVQAYKWVEQGKYNLTAEELKEEDKRLDEKYKRLFSY